MVQLVIIMLSRINYINLGAKAALNNLHSSAFVGATLCAHVATDWHFHFHY